MFDAYIVKLAQYVFNTGTTYTLELIKQCLSIKENINFFSFQYKQYSHFEQFQHFFFFNLEHFDILTTINGNQ